MRKFEEKSDENQEVLSSIQSKAGTANSDKVSTLKTRLAAAAG